MAETIFRIALSHDFRQPDGTAAIAGFDLRRLEQHPRIELTYLDPCEELSHKQLVGINALILMWPRVTAASLKGADVLSVIARFGAGFDNVDLEAAAAAGIAVTNTPDAVRRPVAVAIMTVLLALSSQLFERERSVRERRWDTVYQTLGIGLVGRTLASLGMGNIGTEVFRLAQPFNMRLIAHDPYVDPSLAKGLGVELTGLDDVFREADFLSISVPLLPETRGIVSADRIALMKPTAFLINTARGAVVDQAALTRALKERRLAGAALDVFEKEPLDPDDPLHDLDNVILTPHVLCETDQLQRGIGDSVVNSVLASMSGEVPQYIVNRAVVDSPVFKRKIDANRMTFAR